LGLTLADLLRTRSTASETGTARAVILLWLWGGPSQLDSFDPKPGAPLAVRGPFAPIATRTVGVRMTELFPQIADRSHHFAVLRSLHSTSNDHGVAGTIGLTGSAQGSVNLGGQAAAGSARASIGSVVARARGSELALPPYMVVGGRLHQGKRMIIGEGGGPLGARYDPFRIEYHAEHGIRFPALELPADLTPERLGDRQRLMQALGAIQRAAERSPSLDAYREQAFALLTAPRALRAFDLSREKPETSDRYGRTRFGRSCLLARRLVEHGVPFVQVNWSDHVEPEEDAGDGGWDNHYRNFQIMQDRQAPWLDQTLAALVDDLVERGLWKSTLVLAVGEFGRTPRINDKAGRDHWEKCYCALLGGGGVRGGIVYGESDALTERPHDRPTTPADLAATIHHAVGITSEQSQTLGVATGGRVLHELF
jgi:hypothetical protein